MQWFPDYSSYWIFYWTYSFNYFVWCCFEWLPISPAAIWLEYNGSALGKFEAFSKIYDSPPSTQCLDILKPLLKGDSLCHSFLLWCSGQFHRFLWKCFLLAVPVLLYVEKFQSPSGMTTKHHVLDGQTDLHVIYILTWLYACTSECDMTGAQNITYCHFAVFHYPHQHTVGTSACLLPCSCS